MMKFGFFVLLILLLKNKWSCGQFSGQDPDYVDFTDMGSYKLSDQKHINNNKRYNHHLGGGAAIETTQLLAIDENSHNLAVINNEVGLVPNVGGIVDDTIDQNCKIEKMYLKRLVTSLLRQMQVSRHIFGPGESITIDLRAEISYSQLQTLNKFSYPSSASSRRRNKNNNDDDSSAGDLNLNHTDLKKIDEIIENIFTVVELPPTPHFLWAVLNSFKDLALGFSELLMSFKFWLCSLVFLTFTFLFRVIFFKMRTTDHVVTMLIYGFLLAFILSCLWVYKGLYEEAKSENYARLMQNSQRPTDCDYYEMGYWETFWYYIRVEFGSRPDRCVQYFRELQVDPLWRVSPIDAITLTYTKLIFGPMDFIGKKMGAFFYNIVELFPWFLRPILVVFLFILTFVGIFGFRIKSPFFCLEPARYYYDRNRNQNVLLENNQNNAADDGGNRQIINGRPDERINENHRRIENENVQQEQQEEQEQGVYHFNCIPNQNNLIRISGQIVRLRKIDKSIQVDPNDLKDFIERSRFGGYLENNVQIHRYKILANRILSYVVNCLDIIFRQVPSIPPLGQEHEHDPD